MARADWEQPTDRGVATLGERVRTLRRSAGLSQAELGAGMFSKEYVSQIELGKTRPTEETLEWLAHRLETDREFLEHGVSRADCERIEQALVEAEALAGRGRYEDALAAFEQARTLAASGAPPAMSLRLLLGEAWVQTRRGSPDRAMVLLERAANVAVGPGFTDVDRARVVFQVGVVRYSESRIAEALVLFGESLVMVEGAVGADSLRSDVYHWRARCHRRNRDWVAAEEDVERALELADGISDTRRAADALFQASLVAQRQGRWVLARAQAERSRALFEGLEDAATVARLLNNLAGLNHLLGDTTTAITQLQEAFAAFVDLDLGVEAGYVCSSLAAIHLDRDEPGPAAEQARKALMLLDGREDHVQEIGMAQVALGRALAAQGRLDAGEAWIRTADETFVRAHSLGHRSHAWVAEGDVRSRRGDDSGAADLYRRAAVALLDPDAPGD
jgi:transcriptional regulator with XRE-family HTH domain